MKKVAAVLAFVIILMLPMSLLAHPGHGHTDGYTIKHYFTEPEHLTEMILVTVALGISLGIEAKRKWLRNQ